MLCGVFHFIFTRTPSNRIFYSSCACALSHSVVYDSATPWTAACQAPPSTGFHRRETWSGALCLQTKNIKAQEVTATPPQLVGEALDVGAGSCTPVSAESVGRAPGRAGYRGGRQAPGQLTGLASWRCKGAPVLCRPSVPKMLPCFWKKNCVLIQQWLYSQRLLGFMRNKITFKSTFLRSGMGV